ncbi:MAG: type II restriction endonuclease [Candidatus Izemoplasmatales bacterium]|jgi:type II restriction enzyme|nr:type II restriction endonuclease [Candidatus Izemoplasmatales bacterium]MDY0139519.1 type II restriction endonuclease [Candidatus Izemoplasmatales bacterium]
MKRDFDDWLNTFRDSISNYAFYVDFENVYNHTVPLKRELDLLNVLVGEENIAIKFKELVNKHPEVLKIIPILLAKREYSIFAMDEKTEIEYDFLKPNVTIDEYCYFMDKTGLFNLLSNKIISNLYDYVTGVEAGLNSNGRKNRGGHLMEKLVEDHLENLGLKKGRDFEKEYNVTSIQNRFNIDLSEISNQGTTKKRFDFVVFLNNHIYAIETNFYTSQGSKLNETAGNYELIASKAKKINNFTFIWITDGLGWRSARNSLKQTFNVLETMYNINDLRNGKLKELLGL